MNAPDKDYISEFTIQKKKLRPWAFVLLIDVLAVLFLLPILFFLMGLDKKDVTIFLLISLVILLSALPAYIRFSQCPNCRRYMGRDVSTYCPRCGVQIQK